MRTRVSERLRAFATGMQIEVCHTYSSSPPHNAKVANLAKQCPTNAKLHNQTPGSCVSVQGTFLFSKHIRAGSNSSHSLKFYHMPSIILST